MRSPEWPQFFQWRRIAVDVLIAAATFAVAAAMVAANDVVSVLIVAGALVSLGMLIEPGAGRDAPSESMHPWWRLRST